jgi:hypothetical protein
MTGATRSWMAFSHLEKDGKYIGLLFKIALIEVNWNLE